MELPRHIIALHLIFACHEVVCSHMYVNFPMCSNNTGGTCYVMSCWAWRGRATKCHDSHCQCKEGFCALKGYCVAEDKCDIQAFTADDENPGKCSNDKYCKHFGIASCSKGRCQCQNGTCRVPEVGCQKPQRPNPVELLSSYDYRPWTGIPVFVLLLSLLSTVAYRMCRNQAKILTLTDNQVREPMLSQNI